LGKLIGWVGTGVKGRNDSGEESCTGMTGGDILIASMNSDGTATLENNGSIDGDGGSSNNEGPGGGEFFYEDYFYASSTHKEIIQGALAYLVGADDIPATVFDPDKTDNMGYSAGGVRFFNLSDGTYKASKLLYDKTQESAQGKSTGLGDLELLLDPAPVEIGNRVWLDENGNGIQDANEHGIENVTVQLLDSGGNLIGEVNTSSDGTYIFSSDPNKDDDKIMDMTIIFLNNSWS